MKKTWKVFLACLALFMLMPTTAHADMGPKPSVRIEFTGIGQETYYGTLLSLDSSTGPSSAWNGNPDYAHYKVGDDGYDIWKAFVDYQDADGFYFLQEWWDCTESNQLNWTYHPPSTFKILLYFPETDTFCVSPVYERYAFDSCFTADLSDWETGGLTAEKSYDYTWEAVSLVARILATILIELLIAVQFGYREKRVLRFLAAVNIITQVALNVLLNMVSYASGALTSMFVYVLLELAVFAVEAILYAALLWKYSERPQKRGRAVAYALAANATSFAVGFGIARVIPGIF